MANGITKDTFEKASIEVKLFILFGEIQDLKRQRWKKTVGQVFGSFAGAFLGIIALGKLTLFK